MVYLDADNDLEAAGIDDLNEMEMVGSTENVNIVVLWDGIAEIPGTRVYELIYHPDPGIGSAPIYPDFIPLGHEMNMGDHETLAAFATWAMGEYPAEHYALILWDHGDGWKPMLDCYSRWIRAFISC